jgi:6-phospho-3-hexuloisomerase
MEFGRLSEDVAADVAACLRGVEPGPVEELVAALERSRKVFLIGSGRSGAMLGAMAVRLGHLGIESRRVGASDSPGEGDLVLVGSGSGATPLPLTQARKAREAGASLTLITADPASPIAGLADGVIHVPAPVIPEDGTPHTLRSLFEECLLLVCDCVCRMLQDRLGLTTADMQSRHSARE